MNAVIKERLLTPQELKYVDEYCKSSVKTHAALAAGYSKASLATQLVRLNKSSIVQAHIKKTLEKQSKKLAIEGQKVLQALALIGFSNIHDFLTKDPASGRVVLKQFDQLDRDKLSAVAEFTETDTPHGKRTRLKMYSKLDALEKLGKHLKLFEDQVTNNTQVNVSIGNAMEAISFDSILDKIDSGSSADKTIEHKSDTTA